VNIFVREDAPKQTKDAAKMLRAVVDKVLEQVNAMIPLDAKGLAYMGLTAMPPNTIVIRVSMHPMLRGGPAIDDLKLLKSDKPNPHP